METQFDIIQNLWKYASLFHMVAMLIFPSTIVHNLARVGMFAVGFMIVFFSETKQVGGMQILWSAAVVVFFAIHILSGYPMNPDVSQHRLSALAINYIFLNLYICQARNERGFETFINNLTFAVIMFDIIIAVTHGSTLFTRRFGNVVASYPFGRIRYNSNSVGLINALCMLMQIYKLDELKGKKIINFGVIVANMAVEIGRAHV